MVFFSYSAQVIFSARKCDQKKCENCFCLPLCYIMWAFIHTVQLHAWLSLSNIYVCIYIYLDITIPVIIQSPSLLVTVIIVCCYNWQAFSPSQSMALFPPPYWTRPTETSSQQCSWFMGHFTRKAWGRSPACPTILNLSCRAWRCGSSISVWKLICIAPLSSQW